MTSHDITYHVKSHDPADRITHTIIIQDGDRCVAWEKGHTAAGGTERNGKGFIILHNTVIHESHADTERGTGGWGECEIMGGPRVISTSCVCGHGMYKNLL